MALVDTDAAIRLRLALLGYDLPEADAEARADDHVNRLAAPLLARQRELGRRLSQRLCPADERIQNFLDAYLADTGITPRLPATSFALDEAGLARGLSLPRDGDRFESAYVSSYRLHNGVLHNPSNDRRTTAGVFHIAEGGLPIPDDKIAVRKDVFAKLLERGLQPPDEALELPWTSADPDPVRTFVSLLLRPIVVPEVPGTSPEKTMEVRFIVPGGFVCNLDFVEGIFGNGGDPQLPENDAALDPEHWTGTTGAVILAPHLVEVTKKELGLPAWQDATERQRRDGQCWQDPEEKYNGGQAFKLCARTADGVIVTIIADNYFGYCKKEVKTQISYSANLIGGAEEEHAGGALVFPAYDEGRDFFDKFSNPEWTIDDVIALDPGRYTRQEQGHALIDNNPARVLVPHHCRFSLESRTVSWGYGEGDAAEIPLRANVDYYTPNGYRFFMEQSRTDPTQWHLVGVASQSTMCHKPSTVSGGGKSEISKDITDAFVYANAYVADFDSDMDTVHDILVGDYSQRYADPQRNGKDTRPILSEVRSIGSVIKLLTPSPDFHDDYNAWLRAMPQHIKELVFNVKRAYRPEWGGDWRSHFSVGIMNGRTGNALRLDGQRMIVSTLRVGFEPDGSWRLFSLRPDFAPAMKVQTEDDITASTVLPARDLGVAGVLDNDGDPTTFGDQSRKIVENCEQLLFQRPDDAIHRGYDTQAESDIAGPDTFLSNFEPLTADQAREMRDDVAAFSQFTQPMQDLIRTAADEPAGSPAYFVSSADPRLVNGTPSKNPRYLQVRPDIAEPEATAAADLQMHLNRRLPLSQPIPRPVDLVAAGRRNNPPEEGVPALCPYNPLHFMELPELFMEYISSMTGKSPSTTGAGSEGALTKGPFNALPAVYDLNSALLSYVLTGYDGWVSAAGYVGPQMRVDHDVSLLVPEVFCRMSEVERSAPALIEAGHLERVEDFHHDGELVRASRLGYRMTQRFASTFFGRIFMHPDVVFTEEMLRPELQDQQVFVDSVNTIVATHERVAKAYFADGTVEAACPPLRALLEIMAYGRTAEGHTLDDPQVRDMFTHEAVLASDWYAARLDAQQRSARHRYQQSVDRLVEFIEAEGNADVNSDLGLEQRLATARADLERVSSAAFREGLVGHLGLQPELAG